MPADKIKAWIIANFPDHKSRKDGTEFVIKNPLSYDTGRHFNISLRSNGMCHDWRGNEWAGGKSCTFLRFVQLYRNCSFAEAYKEVCGGIYAPSRHRDIEPEQKTEFRLPDGAELLDGDNSSVAQMLKKWLASRGITEEIIKQYKLMYAGVDVVWPYYEFDELVYWQSRSAINKVFMFPPSSCGVNRRDFIYGFDQVEPVTEVIVTEAIFDALTLRWSCVATGGAVMSEGQVKKIHWLSPNSGITFAPDNDKAGIQSILDNSKLFARYKYPLYYSIPPKLPYKDKNGDTCYTKDWNDLGMHVVGFDNVYKCMLEHRKPLNVSNKIKLRSQISPKPYL